MVRDLQKNVVRRDVTHVDFIKVSDDSPVKVSVPFITHGRSKSVVAGGKLSVTARSIRMNVVPSKIPEKIVYDVTDTPFGTIRAGAVELPEGCELFDDPHTAMLTIKTPRGTTAETEEEEV
jgi:large subunit ribosomal protein L25